MATPYEKTAADTRSNGSPAPDHQPPLQDDGITQTGLPEASTSAVAQDSSQSLANYVDELAQGIAQLADNLRTQNADQALQNAGRMARDNPALFLLGSLALGFGLSRVLKTDSTGMAEPDLSAPASLKVGAYSPIAEHSVSESSVHESAAPERPFTQSPLTESPMTESQADFRDPLAQARQTRDGSQGV